MNHDRRKFIGGADAGVILGLSPFKTPYDLWLEKISEEPEEIGEDKRTFFERRKSLEPFVISLLENEYGFSILNSNERYYKEDNSFITAEIDFEYDRFDKSIFERANGEIKTVNPFLTWQWGESGSIDIPLYIQAQVMHGLMVTNRQKCIVAALIGLDDLRLYEIIRDEEVIDHLFKKELEFWHMVKTKTPPPPTNGSDAVKLFKKDNGKSIIASDEIRLKIDELKQIKGNIKELEKRKECIELDLKYYFKDATSLTDHAGNLLATWKSQERKSLDQKLMEESYPGLIDQFKRTSESRVLLIK
jgi:putative phage-type endonuclease